MYRKGSPARPRLKRNNICAHEGAASSRSQRRNVATNSQLSAFIPTPEGLAFFLSAYFANYNLGFNEILSLSQARLQVTVLSRDPCCPPWLHTLRTITSPTSERRASAPILLNARLSSSQAGGLLMTTIQVTPKECLFGQIDNAWLHVCKLNGQKRGRNSHARRRGTSLRPA